MNDDSLFDILLVYKYIEDFKIKYTIKTKYKAFKKLLKL